MTFASGGKVTVKTIWEAYRKDRNGRRIAQSMDFTGRVLLPEFGHYEPEDVTADVCRAYMAKRRRQGKKVGTYWTELNHLQIALNWAHKARMVPNAVHVERPVKPPARDRRLTKAEARRLLDGASVPHIELAIALMLGTAARSGAIKDLTWDRVNFTTGLIDLVVPDEFGRKKGRAVVPMNADLRSRLKKAKEGAFSDYVVEWAGKRVGSFKRGFRRAVEASGLDDVTPHTLRHTAASWMAERGIKMEVIAAMMGHSDSRTTERIYAKFTPTYLKEASNALDMSDVPSVTREPETENKDGKKAPESAETECPPDEK